MTMSVLVYAGCAGLYVILAAVVLLGRRRGRSSYVLCATCVVVAAWAAGSAAQAAGAQADLDGATAARIAGVLDLMRQAAWYGFILHLYRRSVANGSKVERLLKTLGLLAILAVAATILGAELPGPDGVAPSVSIDVRLALTVCSILLIENLYRNTHEDLRWHVTLPCVALGGLFLYDLFLYSDAALFRRISPGLSDGRAVVSMMVTPLLAIAALRNRRRWGAALAVSHQAVFYSASLVLIGVFLLGLATAGEVVRTWSPTQDGDWALVVELSLICGGILAALVFLTSGSARGNLRNLIVNNFLTHRYDYRVEWLRCIETLSQTDASGTLHTRVIKAVAQVVDSPAGMVFLREPEEGVFRWSGSWNLPAASGVVALDHPLIPLFRGGTWVVVAPAAMPWVEGLGLEGPGDESLVELWLAVPLSHAGALIGFIMLAPSRAPFLLDQEVFALLRIVGKEIANHVAEQRAAEALVQTMQLREYGQRFAFVAHDIKNVASQLSLLLANAEHHIANPEFQRDMLGTIGSSVTKITSLLARLKMPQADAQAGPLDARGRLVALIDAYAPARRGRVQLLADQTAGFGDTAIQMAPSAFDAVINHLLDNALEASAPDAVVQISCQRRGPRVLIDIIDQGVGMTAEFIREHLFRPFSSSKRNGFGLGVYQARELLRQAGGDLIVTSEPGRGTTMQVSVPLAPARIPAPTMAREAAWPAAGMAP